MKLILPTVMLAISAFAAQVSVAANAAAAPDGLRQVLIETVVLEVKMDGLKDLRLKGKEATINGNGVGCTVNLGASPDSMVSELTKDRAVKILQRSRIQTADAVPARLFVGESLPDSRRPGENQGSVSSSGAPIQVGLTFGVTPFIKADGLVLMDIQIRRDSLERSVVIRNVGPVPVTSSTETQTQVTVRDHDTILLGGLRGEDKTSSAPVLRSPKDLSESDEISSSARSKRSVRSELLVIVRPTLLPGRAAAKS